MSRLKLLPLFILPAFLTLVIVPACDTKSDKTDKTDGKSEQDKAVEARLAKKRADREAAKKAEEDAETAKQAKLEEICVLPEEMPKDLEKACDAVGVAMDGFMLRLFEGDAVTRWNEAKGTQLGMAKKDCLAKASIENAACQANAMNLATVEIKKALPDLQLKCVEKFVTAEPAAPPAGG